MNYGSVCSGIEAATVAWHTIPGWGPVWFSEIEPFACKVLQHHYPGVPNLGDMTRLTQNEIFQHEPIDLLVGGTPCQSFSIAGLRGGLSDDRGNLALEFCRLLVRKKPRWFVWENVPGVFSSFSDETNGESVEGIGFENGRDITETADFATLLEAFRQCGYCCAYRVLDAQFFGVPQRRRRVFVVGYFGNDWRPPATVLFEPESLSGNIKKGRKKRQDVAGTLDARTKGGGFPGSDGAMNGHVIPYQLKQITSVTNRSNPKVSDTAPTLTSDAPVVVPALTRRPYADNASNESKLIPCWWDGGQVSQTLDRVLIKGQMMPEKNRFPAILWSIMPQNSGKDYKASNVEVAQPLMRGCGSFNGNQGGDLIQEGLRVRRITPLEAERLQGFPDGYTNIPGASDTARYQTIGNSMAIPVMAWIGKRIDIVDKYFNHNYARKDNQNIP